MNVELVCGAKIKGASGRKVHAMRRPGMKRAPVLITKFEGGEPVRSYVETRTSATLKKHAEKEAAAQVQSIEAASF